ncbi:hypothetical protein WJX84_011941 [Apatococcus fuscideae]|uniref:Alpha-L-fucosidase n=1 Tax=Apatococcus fuscideae TaxID=2026836 RepID=A0AAW1SLH2_9CHLO
MGWHEAVKGLLSRSGRSDHDQTPLVSEIPSSTSQLQSLATPSRQPDHCLTVDLSRKQHAFEGFGTSLCWWANIVGGFPEPLRSQLVDLIFDPERGLGLQCARYNIGRERVGSCDRAWLRYGADIDSFWGPQQQWDWSNGLQGRGCASGNYQGWMDNLRPEFHDAFVKYLVTVVKHFRDDFGLNFRTLDPFNESTSTWWQRGGRSGRLPLWNSFAGGDCAEAGGCSGS